jgi:anti-sigma-K factor RskA
MIMRGESERRALAGEYVLGVLDEAEMARAEALLAADKVFAREVADWQERLAPLDETAAPITAPAELWLRIEAATADREPAPAARPAVAAARPSWAAALWERIEFWRWSALAGGAWALALLIIVGAMAMRWPSQPVMIAVLSGDNGRPGAVVESFSDGTVRLIPLADIAVPEGRALQVWTLRDRQEGPISVGLLDRAQSMRLDLGKLPAPRADQLFEITLEPETGSPTGRPTGPVLMKGLTSGTL